MIGTTRRLTNTRRKAVKSAPYKYEVIVWHSHPPVPNANKEIRQVVAWTAEDAITQVNLDISLRTKHNPHMSSYIQSIKPFVGEV